MTQTNRGRSAGEPRKHGSRGMPDVSPGQAQANPGRESAGSGYTPAGSTHEPQETSRNPDEMPSLGEILGEISDDLSRLFRQELQLAKAEVRQEASKAGKAAGMLAGAVAAAILLLVFLSAALMYGLGNVMNLGWAALIVAAVWLIIGGVLFTVGRKQLRNVSVPRKTVDTLQEDARWLRNPTG